MFIVSYNEGIGQEKNYNSKDFAAISQESEFLNYNPCFKTNEYTTNRLWLNLSIDDLKGLPDIDVYNEVSKILIRDNKHLKDPNVGNMGGRNDTSDMSISNIKYLASMTKNYILLQSLTRTVGPFEIILSRSRLLRKIFIKLGLYKKVFAGREV